MLLIYKPKKEKLDLTKITTMKKILSAICVVVSALGHSASATELNSGVDLVSFDAFTHAGKVDLKWVTKTENVTAFFIVERSRDGKTFEEVIRVEGVAKGQFYMEYFDADYSPLEGVSYYRLKQTNAKGEELLHNIISVNYNKPITTITPGIAIAQNPESPATDFNVLLKGFEGKQVLVVLRNNKGEEFFSKVYLSATAHHLIALDPQRSLPRGEYIITASVNNQVYCKPISVK